jgi:hypothetical protein
LFLIAPKFTIAPSIRPKQSGLHPMLGTEEECDVLPFGHGVRFDPTIHQPARITRSMETTGHRAIPSASSSALAHWDSSRRSEATPRFCFTAPRVMWREF